MISPGTYKLGPSDASLLIRVFREGLAKKVGHDLVLEATRWQAELKVEEDVTKSTVSGSADIASFEVREATGGVKPLSDGDRSDIKKNTDKTLQTRNHPQITFRSTSVKATDGNRATVSGDLTVAGTTRPVEMDVSVDAGRFTATMQMVQTQWGIKPYSGLMGALKIKDAVDIEVQGPLPKG